MKLTNANALSHVQKLNKKTLLIYLLLNFWRLQQQHPLDSLSFQSESTFEKLLTNFYSSNTCKKMVDDQCISFLIFDLVCRRRILVWCSNKTIFPFFMSTEIWRKLLFCQASYFYCEKHLKCKWQQIGKLDHYNLYL